MNKVPLAEPRRPQPPLNNRVETPLPYEMQLDRDPRWALSEGSCHFEEKSAVFVALRKIAQRLSDLEIPYAVVGGMALFQHGLRRFTEDVDILVSKENLKKIHEALEGLGYLPAHRHSKNLRDAELGVRIEFLTTGEFPGDGKEKPVAFPEPSAVSFEAGGVRYINLPNLIELKLASGMTNPSRLKDLADVLELIKILPLPADYAQQLHPFVRETYAGLYRQSRKRFVARWRKDRFASADILEAMRQEGVVLEESEEDVFLATTDPEVAKKYDMVEELEFWEEADDAQRPDESGQENP